MYHCTDLGFPFFSGFPTDIDVRCLVKKRNKQGEFLKQSYSATLAMASSSKRFGSFDGLVFVD